VSGWVTSAGQVSLSIAVCRGDSASDATESPAGASPLASADGSPLMVKRAIIHGFEKVIPTVRASLDTYQARFKRNWDSRVRQKEKDLAVGLFFYLRSHRGGHRLLPKSLGPFEILDTSGTYFAIDQGDGEGQFNSNDVAPAPRPMSGPDYQPHLFTQAPLLVVNSSDEDPTVEIDRLLDIRHKADNGIVAKVRWATYGRGDDSWKPISVLPKHLVIRLAKKNTFTLPDDAFPTSPVVLAPSPRQPDWVCVALQQHTDGTGTVLVDVRWTDPTTSHEETVAALWASPLIAEFPEDPPPAHWALGRPAFEYPDAVWGPHTVDQLTTAAATHFPVFVPLSSFFPQVVALITSYEFDLTLFAPRWQHQSW